METDPVERDPRDPEQATPEEQALLAQAIDEDNKAVDWTPERPWMRGFLVAYSISGNVTRACERIGISDEAVRTWRKRSTPFANAFAQASERAADRLEETARAWGTTGLETRTITTRTLPDGGTEITEKISRQRSPALLMRLLEATRPEKYRRNVRVEQTGAGGGPIEHEVTHVDETVRDFRQELERLGHAEEPVPQPTGELPAA